MFGKTKEIDAERRQIVMQAIEGLRTSLLAGGYTGDVSELLEAISRLSKRMDKLEDPAKWANRLVNYIQFNAYNKVFKLNSQQHEYVLQLEDVGKYAGLNGSYRTDYGSLNQF